MARYTRGDRVRLEAEQHTGLFGSIPEGTLGVVLEINEKMFGGRMGGSRRDLGR
jgi:hypothetical protein